ncbi:MAG: VWA domain-containing protein [Opitutaceae bacterium]|nr:VWA domain-containing protein [Opitutaceae bacterium]
MKLIPTFLLGSAASLFAGTPSSVNAASAAHESVRLQLSLDRSVLPAGQRERAIVKVSLEGIMPSRPEIRAPVNLALVLDRSGSMNGEKIERARAAALEAVRRLSPDDVFSLVVYNNTAESLIPARRVGDGSELEETIRSIRSFGGTALYDGVMRGASELRHYTDDTRYLHRLILLSDGLANVGPSSAEELARLGGTLVREGISVTTIGVGLDYNEDLMTRLAQRSDGNTYFVASSRDLPGIFKREIGEVLSIVARRVVVTVTLPEGIRPVGLVGREGLLRGQTVEVTLNQLYGGQEKFALIEVEVEGAADGREREIARAEVTFEDPIAGRSEKLEARRSVRFATDERKVIASANLAVQTDYARNLTAVAKDAAVGLVDAQRRDEAARQLRERNQSLERMAKTYQNSAVLSIVASNAAEADRLERDGLDNVARKTYRAENAQTTGQQAVRN